VITTHLFTDHAQQADKIGRAERLDDEGGGPDGARERAVLRIVVSGEQHDADGSRVARRRQFATDREAIAVVSLEVHVEQHHLGPVLARQGETLIRARGFENGPALSRQRDSRDRAQSGVVVRDEDGGGVGSSPSAERAKAYVVGLRRSMPANC
jgi:hypothetical protein